MKNSISTNIKFDSRKSSVATPIIIALAISLITIATLIVIATKTLDAKDTKLTRQMINSSLLFMMQELEKTTMDLAWYDEAIQKIFIDKDLYWVDDNYGKYLYHTYNIDASFIVDAKGKTFISYLKGKLVKLDAYQFIGNDLALLVDKAWHETKGSRELYDGVRAPKPQSGFVLISGNPYIVSVCAFTPEEIDPADLVEIKRPILVFLRDVNETLLKFVSDITLIQDLKISSSKDTDICPSYNVVDLSGNIISKILWQPPSDGKNLLLMILPVIIIVLFAVGWFTRIFIKKDLAERKKTEQILLNANEVLEKKVLERTQTLRRSNEDLANQINLRKEIEREILSISEREQSNIGQEIHDSLCQQLTGILCLCGVSKTKLDREKSSEIGAMLEIIALLRESLEHAYNLSRGLYPLSLDTTSLSSCINDQVLKVKKIFNIHCEFDCNKKFRLSDHSNALHFYRIFQEALNNAVKHSKATKITIRLKVTEETISMDIHDNGIGFLNESESVGGMGLKIMEYRANIIGGCFDIFNAPEGGTIVSCSIDNE